jgi:sterol desaturase/sphingolipid hydroxylase (fatty acid hydroxylase superfamily)
MMNNTWIRLGVFITVLAVTMLWENLRPNRLSPVSKGERWLSNFSMVLLSTVVARLIILSDLAAMAIFAQNTHIGLWNRVSASLWLSIPISVLLFDCFIYWQH